MDRNKRQEKIDKIESYVYKKVDYILTFGGLVPQKKDIKDKDKEEHISMKDLQDMIKSALKKQTERIDYLSKNLEKVLEDEKTDENIEDHIENTFQSQEETHIENKENIPSKEENTIEQNLDDVTKNAFINPYDMHAEMKEKFQVQSEQFHAQREQFQAQSEQLQQVVEMLNSMKSKENMTPRKKVKKAKPKTKPSQKVQDTKLKSTPVHSSNDDNIIFNYISPDELSNKDQELKSLKQEIKKQRKENEKLLKILSKRNNETSDTSSEPGYYYFTK